MPHFNHSKLFRTFAIMALAALLVSCAANSNPTLQMLRHTFMPDSGLDQAQLDSRYRYLRFTLNGKAVPMVLGYLEQNSRGTVEVWFGGDRQVLRLQNGRIIGFVGLSEEWREVRLPELPSWAELIASGQPLEWTRLRDAMPDYRFNIEDRLVLIPIAPPEKSALWQRDANELSWFEERDQSGRLLPARYALEARDGQAQVIYAEQCFSNEICLSWQHWLAPQKS